MKRTLFDPGIPLGFKLFFGGVATLVLLVWALVAYVMYSAVQAGPEGLGKVIGSVVRGYNEASK